jgi:threonine dehydrogenase-like Zn-dependent dehydrogenase
MKQAIGCVRNAGYLGYVGVPHGVQFDASALFFQLLHLHGGPAPVRRYLPRLIELIWSRAIDPGKVFDLTLPLAQVADAYRAMDERRAIKVLLTT